MVIFDEPRRSERLAIFWTLILIDQKSYLISFREFLINDIIALVDTTKENHDADIPLLSCICSFLYSAL